MTSARRFGFVWVPPLLVALGIAAGIGLGAFASGADFRSGSQPARAGRVSDVEVLPRITVTPHGAGKSEPALQASERCSRLHC